MKKKENGFTLVEMLIVISVFSALSIMVASIVVFSVRNSKKSEITYNLRSKMDNALEIMSRQLRNAVEITSTCEGSPSSGVEYKDQDGNPAFFSCNLTDNQIASGSGTIVHKTDTYYLIESGVVLDSCSITCSQPDEIGIPYEVTISLSAQSLPSLWPQSDKITEEVKVVLRNKSD